MESPRSAEELRKIDLSLDELTKKVQSRVQLIRDDLKSLIGEIENLRNHIDDRRRTSNDYSREISDLTNEHQALLDQLAGIEKESSRAGTSACGHGTEQPGANKNSPVRI